MVVVHVIVSSGSMGRFTGVLVHQALVQTNDSDLMTKVCKYEYHFFFQNRNKTLGFLCQLELFSMQILHSNPRCSLNLFDFDWELIFSVITKEFL